MAADPIELRTLTAATEPKAAARRLAALTGAAQRETARQAEAQYLVTNLVPLLEADQTAALDGGTPATASAQIDTLRAQLAEVTDPADTQALNWQITALRTALGTYQAIEAQIGGLQTALDDATNNAAAAQAAITAEQNNQAALAAQLAALESS